MRFLQSLTSAALMCCTFGISQAQGLKTGDLAVGNAPGKIGLHQAVNEECRGPATITALDGGRIAILDKVNGKIVVLGGPTPIDVQLPPQLIEPSDIAATTKGYMVAGALGDVFLVDNSARILAKTKPVYDPVSGTPRIISLAGGRFALENVRGERVGIDISPTLTGALAVPGSSNVGAYAYSQTSTGDVTALILSTPSKSSAGAAGSKFTVLLLLVNRRFFGSLPS